MEARNVVALTAAVLIAALLDVSVEAGPAVPRPDQPVLTQPQAPSPTEIALRAQLEEIRRSEDRLLQTVYFALTTVVALAIGLSAFSWWSANRVYQHDIAAVRAELERAMQESIHAMRADLQRFVTGAVADLRRESDERWTAERSRMLSEANANALRHVADIKLALGDMEGAARIALELHETAVRSNPNYCAHAFDKLIMVLETIQRDSVVSVPLSDDTRKQIQTLAVRGSQTVGEERVQRLQSLLDATR